MDRIVKVALAQNAYDITIGEHVLARAGELLAPMLKRPRVVVVTDANVAKLYLHRLTNALAAVDVRVAPIIVPAGEASKNLNAFTALVEQVLATEPDRHTTIIALGGGVIGDLAGFAASVVLRGLPFVQIPTTLLAQVDSSVGGKTGVNASLGKNVVGAFYQPQAVLIDVDVLQSLPKRELQAGYAEVVKYGAIADATFFAWLEQHGSALLAGDKALQIEAIERSCNHKAAIVAADEKETKGLRALLNFGHTFGHALEAEMGYNDSLLHGEAVAIGMVLAAELSASLGHCAADVPARIEAALKNAGLRTRMAELGRAFDAHALMTHMAHDKKAEIGSLTFILLKSIGEAFVAKGVEEEAVQRVLGS